jgi:hypothetical protein
VGIQGQRCEAGIRQHASSLVFEYRHGEKILVRLSLKSVLNILAFIFFVVVIFKIFLTEQKWVMEKAKRFGLRIPNRLNGQVLVRFFKIRTFEESNQ